MFASETGKFLSEIGLVGSVGTGCVCAFLSEIGLVGSVGTGCVCVCLSVRNRSCWQFWHRVCVCAFLSEIGLVGSVGTGCVCVPFSACYVLMTWVSVM